MKKLLNPMKYMILTIRHLLALTKKIHYIDFDRQTDKI